MFIQVILTAFVIALLFGLCTCTDELLKMRQQQRNQGKDIITYL